MEHRLHLDRSVPERYWLRLTGLGDTNGDIGLLQGTWGRRSDPVWTSGQEIGTGS